MVDFETILYEKRDHTALITLNRPDRLNAFNDVMTRELVEAYADIAEDENIRSIVLTANGRAFCSGVDLASGRHQPPAEGERPRHWKPIGPAYRDPSHYLSPKGQRLYKPYIVAINGICAGGGFYFLQEADIPICSDRATFTEPHTSHGLAACVEMVGLRWRIPVAWTMRMALMGKYERLSPEQALMAGLVTEIVPHEQLLDRALAIAEIVNRNAPVANIAAVETMWRSMDMPREAALDFAYTMAIYHNGMSEDNKEGPRAFLEKREPRWTGR